jgi:hypothetical protein
MKNIDWDGRGSDGEGDLDLEGDPEREGGLGLEGNGDGDGERGLDLTYRKLERKVRRWIIFFMVALVLSGLTAFGLETELGWLVKSWPFSRGEALYWWVLRVYAALRDINIRYPFLAYGYDWLAFAHLVIAVAFVGPFRDPVRNKWVIEFGMIACIMIFPLAFIAGAVRGIPIYWRLIDCSFGVVGLVPLLVCYRRIRMLERYVG